MTAMAFGLPPAALLVGPDNQCVAKVKRQFYGRVRIDRVAGPTDSMVVAARFGLLATSGQRRRFYGCHG